MKRSAAIRFWFARHQGGVVIALVTLVLVLLVTVTRSGPPTQLVGRVAGFERYDEVKKSYPVANVELPGRRVTVQLYPGHSCAIGDRIHILKQRRPWGVTYQAGATLCDFRGKFGDAQAR